MKPALPLTVFSQYSSLGNSVCTKSVNPKYLARLKRRVTVGGSDIATIEDANGVQWDICPIKGLRPANR